MKTFAIVLVLLIMFCGWGAYHLRKNAIDHEQKYEAAIMTHNKTMEYLMRISPEHARILEESSSQAQEHLMAAKASRMYQVLSIVIVALFSYMLITITRILLRNRYQRLKLAEA